MLEIENLERTNFVDGMIFNPEQLRLNDEYNIQRNALIARYGLGKGILFGYLGNLRVSIENSQLIIHPGAAIDDIGNIILVKKKYVVLKDINISQFQDKTIISIYARFQEDLKDQKPLKSEASLKHFYKIEEGCSIEIKEKMMSSGEFFELGRIFIDHSVSSSLKEAVNPYNPSENEIDLRFTYKNFNASTLIKYNEKTMISNIMRKYADYLTELSFNRKSFSASIAAASANRIVIDIKNLNLSANNLYETLQHLLYISRKIEDEIPQIVNTGFWKNILRLQSLFSFSESCDVDYYDLLLNVDSSFFSKVLLHFGNASIFDGDWGELDEKDDTDSKEPKEYISVGRSSECDIVIKGEDIEDEHARLYPFKEGYLIEDVSNSSGIYINAERLESDTRRYIRHQDFTTIGKYGNVLNLTQVKV